jgi:dTMP kinase
MPLTFGLKRNGGTKEVKRGKFIVIDGTDGSGITTQTALLKDTLAIEGYEVAVADFPRYGQKSAGMVEEYLNGKYGQVNPQAASIFYAVDRFDASREILQWLNEGKIVICNRYVTANAGHQGGKIEDAEERIKFFRWLDHLEYQIFNIPRPDLNVILHMPAETAQGLVDRKDASARVYAGGKKRDLHEADLNHLKHAEQVYLELANLLPNTKVVRCVEEDKLLTPQEVHAKVWQLVRRIALKNME